MRDSSSLLPTSSVEMKTDQFSSYAYGKAVLVFAATTVAYFALKATGLPNWFWGSSPSGSGELEDSALTSRESSSLMTQEVLPEVAVFSMQSESAESSRGFVSDVTEPSLIDFQEADLPSLLLVDSVSEDEAGESQSITTDEQSAKEAESVTEDEIIIDTSLLKSNRRRLLQQTSDVTVVSPIPNQVIQVNQQYVYPLGGVFANYSLLEAVETGKSSLPSWLSVQPLLFTVPILGSGLVVYGVAINGSTAFVADVTGLQIVDVSNPSNPRLLSTVPAGSGGYILGVAISGTTAFVANQYLGLQILDVSNTSNPRLLSTVPGGYPQGVAISGNTAFVADGPIGLQILDVSNPSNPRLLSTVPVESGEYIYRVAISGNIAFVTGEEGLQIIDVSNTSNPRLLSTFPGGFGGYNQATIRGTTAFVAGENTGLQILDVSNTSNPRLLSTTPIFSGSGGPAGSGVAISGNIAFVTGGEGLQIIDVSNLGNPRLLSIVPPTPGWTAGGVAISGSTVFVADGGAGFQIIDVSQASLVGVPPLALVGQTVSITVSAWNMNRQTSVSDTFTLTLDLLPRVIQSSVPDQSIFPGHSAPPLLLNSEVLFVNSGNSFLKLSVGFNNGSSAPSWLSLTMQPVLIGAFPSSCLDNNNRVTISGSTAFVLCGSAVQIIDVSNPSNPQLLSTFPGGGGEGGIAISGNIAFVPAGNVLRIIDVSNPSNPRLLSTVSPPPLGGYVGGVAISGNTAFVTTGTGLQIIDVSNTSNPRLLSTVPVESGYTYGVAISGTTAFVTFLSNHAIEELQIIDVSNTSNPQLLSTFPVLFVSRTNEVAISGSTAFVADGAPNGAGLQILDVSNTSNPRLLSTFLSVSYNTFGVAISGSTAFVANGLVGLQIIDVSNTSNPRLLSTVPVGPGENTYGVAISGNTAFVADDFALQILGLTPWQFTASPGIADEGNYLLQLTAIDALGGSISTQPFTIRVEGPPRINGTINQQYAKVGQAFNYFVPQGLITDPNFDPISFTTAVKGSPSFPAWLSFNGVSAIFVGVPQETDVGNFTVILSATDNIPGTTILDTTFGLLVDHLPVVTQSIPAQVAGIGLLYNYTPPDTLFYEPDGYPMSYSAQQSNRLPLPFWLAFNTTSRLFSGRPNSTDAGSYSIAVTAQDNYQGQAKADFVLVVENFPVINQKIVAPLAGVGVLFNWVVPFNAFVDQDNEPLTYTADQQDSSNLPNWLTFNPQTLTFFGEPLSSDVRTLSLRLNATDPSGGRAQQTFNLTVSYFPEVKGTIPDQLADIDQLYEYTVASDVFSQEDHTVLIYSVNQSSGALPDWLSFNSTSRQLKGTPNITAWGDYDLQMVATNVWGAQAIIDFPLTVEYFPVVSQSLQPPLAGVGVAFNWAIPTNAFMDLDNDLLTYTAHQQDGSLLPNWLGFNSRALVFSGVPQSTDVTMLPLTLSVTDSKGAQAQQSFNLTVTYFPRLGVTSVPSQLSNIDAPYLYTIPPSVFAEDEPLVLMYSARQSSGLALPDWLHFNATMLQLSGRPNVTAAGIYDLEVIATNPVGASISASFSLQVEHFPEVVRSLISPLADISSVFSFSVSADSFIDKDGDPLTYSAQRENMVSLPIWLAFNPQSLSFSGVPLETDKGDLPLQLTATDSVGATVTANLTIQVIHFPVLAHPASTMTFRAGQFFNFSLPPDTFTDQDQVGLSYSIQQPLPDWLAFKNQTLSFSGTPTSGNIGTVSLILMATDTRGAAVNMNFQIEVRGNVPPAALEAALSNQAATVGQVFSYFLPVPLFVDSYNNTLTYSATQQDNSPLPGWLSFDNQSLHFSGTPGHGDTNFYATRTVGVKVLAQSEEGQAGINVNIIVDGISWGQMAVNIGAPLVSVLTTLYALYEARALLLNRCRHEKHARKTITKQVGEKFKHEFKVDSVEQIYKVQAGIHDSARRCYEFSKPTYRLLPGGEQLPWWMEYSADKNLLYSTVEVDEDGIGVVPPNLKHMRLELQAEDEDGIILDKIILNIMPALKLKLEKNREEKYEKPEDQEDERNTQNIKSTATVAEGGDIELVSLNESKNQSSATVTTSLIGSKKPSDGDLRETKKESPPINTRRTKVPSVTNLIAPDSPLRQGTRTTSSVMEGDSRKKLVGKETGDDQIARQSRSCC